MKYFPIRITKPPAYGFERSKGDAERLGCVTQGHSEKRLDRIPVDLHCAVVCTDLGILGLVPWNNSHALDVR
jgi:hypothetical protein